VFFIIIYWKEFFFLFVQIFIDAKVKEHIYLHKISFKMIEFLPTMLTKKKNTAAFKKHLTQNENCLHCCYSIILMKPARLKQTYIERKMKNKKTFLSLSVNKNSTIIFSYDMKGMQQIDILQHHFLYFSFSVRTRM
jgi:plasmid maintenance system killer protein